MFKCAHISDVHFRSLKRHNEYRQVFTDLFLKLKEIGEDDEKSSEKNVQTITDDHIKIVDEKVSLKEKEIMTI